MTVKGNKKSRRRGHHWWFWGILTIIAVSITLAIIRYRSSLEEGEPIRSGEIIFNEAISVRDLRICLPSSESPGFAWSTERVTPDRIDRSALLHTAVTAWGHGLFDMTGTEPASDRILEHCFLDERGTAYIDFNGRFMDAFPASTTSEMLILASLFYTVRENIRTVRHIAVMRDGFPVETWAGHARTDFSRNPLLLGSDGVHSP